MGVASSTRRDHCLQQFSQKKYADWDRILCVRGDLVSVLLSIHNTYTAIEILKMIKINMILPWSEVLGSWDRPGEIMGTLAAPAAALPGPGFLCPWLHRQRGKVEGGRVVMVMATSASRPSRPRGRGH